jgi:hypothetical protein
LLESADKAEIEPETQKIQGDGDEEEKLHSEIHEVRRNNVGAGGLVFAARF